MDRLLTDKEITKEWHYGDRSEDGTTALQRIANAEHIKTLKAVGEWLEERSNGTEYEGYDIVAIIKGDIDQLKQGKMPE